MAAKNSSFVGKAADAINENRQKMGVALSKMLGPGPDTIKATPQQELALWMSRSTQFANAGRDAQLWEAYLQQGMKPEDIVDLQFPYRKRLMVLGRPELEDQARYAADMASKAAAAERQQTLLLQEIASQIAAADAEEWEAPDA